MEGMDSGGGGHFQPSHESLTVYTLIMELESDTYDVIVIGTGLAQSIVAA